MSNMRILGTGSALPAHEMNNEELSNYVETSDEWIRERTGIRSRHISTGETVVSLAAEACKKALEMAGRSAEEVDLILLDVQMPIMDGYEALRSRCFPAAPAGYRRSWELPGRWPLI